MAIIDKVLLWLLLSSVLYASHYTLFYNLIFFFCAAIILLNWGKLGGIIPYSIPLIVYSFFFLFSLLATFSSVTLFTSMIEDDFFISVREFTCFINFYFIAYIYKHRLTSLLLILAQVIFFNVALVGLFIYLFYYEDLYIFFSLSSNMLNIQYEIADFNFPRLFSLATLNSNDTSTYLGISFIVFLLNRRNSNIILLIIFIALVLTKSRGTLVVMIILFFLMSIFKTFSSGKVNVSVFKRFRYVFVIFAMAAFFFGFLYQSLHSDSVDSRYFSYNNAFVRYRQYTDYIRLVFQKVSLFKGAFNYSLSLSSESFYLQFLYNKGFALFVVMIFMVLYFLIKMFLKTYFYLRHYQIDIYYRVLFLILFYFINIGLSLHQNNLLFYLFLNFLFLVDKWNFKFLKMH